MVDYLYGPVQHDAFFRKYASKKFLKGTLIPLSSRPRTAILTRHASIHRPPSMGQEVRPHVSR